MTADERAQISATGSNIETYANPDNCPITHSSLAHPRAYLQFTNHVSYTFIKGVNFCPTCGEKL